MIGETLGISKGRIIKNVLIPNSVSTLIEMFSYFFLNSMITISAVAFLCTYDNQPLSILITTYEKNSNYEMQSVISLIILFLNVLARVIFTTVANAVKKADNTEIEGGIGLERHEFDFLTYLEKRGKGVYSQRRLADELTISLSNVTKYLKDLEEKDCPTSFCGRQLTLSLPLQIPCGLISNQRNSKPWSRNTGPERDDTEADYEDKDHIGHSHAAASDTRVSGRYLA